MFKKTLILVVGVLFLTQPALSSAANPAALQKFTLMLEWFVNPDHGPIIVAERLGYFKESGLDITIQEPSGPDTPAKLVAAGSIDLGIYYQPSLTRAVSDGLPLTWAGTLISSPLDGVTVLDKGPIKSLADMKGKTLGVSVKGSERMVMDTLLAPWGVGFDDVKVINVGWNLTSALMAGRVDAILGGYRNFELNSLKLNKKPGRMFYLEEHGIPPYDALIYIANPKKADKKAIGAFLDAVEKGGQYIANHPQKAWKLFVSYRPDTLDNDLNRIAWQSTLTHFALRPAARDERRYLRYARFMKAHKEIKEVPSINQLMLHIEG